MLVATILPEKTPAQLVADRHAGFALAMLVFALVLVALLVGVRRLRGRVMEERADRVLRERFDRLDGDS